MRRESFNSQGGFTLVEMVVAIVLTAIVVGFATVFLNAPVDAYFAQTRRAELVDNSDALSRSLARDLRMAVPNSVRIRNAGTRAIVEMLVYDQVAFYDPTVGDPNRELRINTIDTAFATLGQLVTGPRPFIDTTHRLSVMDSNVAPNPSPYLAANRAITPAGTQITFNIGAAAGEDLVTLTPGYRFGNPSPTSRMFFVRTPVTYICNSAANARWVRRYENYPVTATIPTQETSAQLLAAGVVNTVVASDMLSCAVTCRNASVAPLPCQRELVINMTTGRVVSGVTEQVRVFAEFPVENRS